MDLTLLNATSVVNGIGAPPTAGHAPRTGCAGRSAGRRVHLGRDRPGQRAGRAASGRGCSGPAYKALVVDDQEALPAATAKRLVALARAGLPVVVYGRVPAAGVGYKDAAAEDAAVDGDAASSAGCRNVRVARTPAALVSALRALAVRPDLRARRASTIVPVHRRTKAGDVWFLYNDSPRRARGRFTFATPGAPSEIDLWTGRATRLAEYTRRGGRVTVPLSLAPGATALLTFDRRREGRAQHRQHQRGLFACRRRATRPARSTRRHPQRPAERRHAAHGRACRGFPARAGSAGRGGSSRTRPRRAATSASAEAPPRSPPGNA